MSIIVDEVVISVEVTNREAEGKGGAAPAGGAEDKQAIIAECVERMLEILREREER